MAILFTDGFDNYGTTTGTNILTRWTSATLPNNIITSITPYNYGQSYYTATTSTNVATIGFTPTSTITVGAAVYITGFNSTINYPIFGLLAGGTWMIGLVAFSDGSPAVSRQTGATGGTGIAGFNTPGVLKLNQWHYLEMSITISDTVGTVRVDVDGATVINQTGLDTRNGTPTTVNVLSLGTNNAAGVYFDDLYISDSITPLGPQRIYTLKPNADTVEKDWTSTAGWNVQDSTSTLNAPYNSAHATKGNVFTCLQNSSLTGISIYFHNTAQTVKVGIAELSGSTVASVLYESGTVARTATAGYQTFTFSPVSLTSGKTYLIYATRTDGTGTTPLTVYFSGSAGQLTPDRTGSLQCVGYGVAADNAIATSDAITVTTTATAAYSMYLNYSGFDNYISVNDPYDTDTDISYVTASTVGDFDLYDVENYPAANANIKAVNHLVWAKKTDAATRTMNLTTKSSSTTTDSTAVSLSASYSAYGNLYETDPATSTAWTVSGVNALQIGQKVAS